MVQQPVLQTLGSWLAVAYATYGVVLLLGWVLALHTYVLVGTLYITRRSRWARGRFSAQELVVEFFYGFLNPLVYLIVLAHIPAAPWQQTPWLIASAWALFALFWGARLFGRHPEQNSEFWRRVSQLVLAASLLLVIVYLLRDCTAVVGQAWLEPPKDFRAPAWWRIPLLTFFALS